VVCCPTVHHMSRVEDVWFRSGERHLFARIWGAGDPLVLMHGSHLNSHAAFAESAARLGNSFTVIAPDIRGFGRSVCSDAGLHTWDQYVTDLFALLDQRELAAATIGGQSFSAGIAVAAALREPRRVRALVIAQPAYAGAEVGTTVAQQPVWVRVRALLEEAEADGLTAALLRTRTDEPGREWVRKAVAEQQDERSFVAAHRGEMGTVQPFRSLEELHSIQVPVLLFPGDDAAHDPLITQMYAEHLPHVVRARTSSMNPSDWVSDLLDFMSPAP
jgi:3-oxoadipate enol-lactonase